jgi:hypothetical protein
VIDNDDDLYAHVRSDFAGMRLRAPISDITARGSRVRRRRQTTTALSLAVLAAATTTGLALGLPADRTQTPAPAPPMNAAAWSVETRPDGSILLTIRQLTDPDELTRRLEKAGVPAKVEFKQLRSGQTAGCRENGQPSSPLLRRVLPMPTVAPKPGEQIFTIRRDLMPAGTSLHVVIMEESGSGVRSRSVHTALVNGEPLACELPD